MLLRMRVNIPVLIDHNSLFSIIVVRVLIAKLRRVLVRFSNKWLCLKIIASNSKYTLKAKVVAQTDIRATMAARFTLLMASGVCTRRTNFIRYRSFAKILPKLILVYC